MVLSAFFLLAIWLDPSEPSRYARHTYGILAGYLAYALVLGAVVWRRDAIRNNLQVLSHVVDLMVFAVLMFFTEGPTSPFFVYFVFLLVCATLRWQRRGTFWTAVISLAVVVALALVPSNLFSSESFELNRLIIRVVYLAVVAALLGYLGAYEQSMRKTLGRLAEWPRPVPTDVLALTREMLGHAADILNAPRMILAWDEEEEPSLHLATWSRDGVHYGREHPAKFGTIVSGLYSGISFFCKNAADPLSPVWCNSPEGLQQTQVPPLQHHLQQTFAIGAVLALYLKGENLSGYLLVLDKSQMTADDLVLGEIVARETAARLDHYFLMKRLQHAAASDERVRLARDLHDGLLQSLTGAALQLETVQRLMVSDPQTARQRLQEIQRLIGTEQRDLRTHIQQLKPAVADLQAETFDLPGRLADFAERIQRQWDLSVEITTHSTAPRMTRSMAREIYFVVHEAVINAVRHAGAATLRADLSFEADRVHIVVCDDGHGFPFRGIYDHGTLSTMKRGPVTLRERITDLGGRLTIDSRDTGARLDITLPLTEYGGHDVH
jgi:signal transduction histidine kinase